MLEKIKWWCVNSQYDFVPMKMDSCLFQRAPASSRYPVEMYYRLLAAHTGKTELANDVNRARLGIMHDYYNSGMLLMNLELGRKEIVPEYIFQYIEEHRKELVLPDQDLLNAVYGDRIFPLDDAVWNYDARNYNNYMMRSSAKYNLKWVIEHTAILHFCGKQKPWKQPYLYRFGMLYYHYEQLARRSWGDG